MPHLKKPVVDRAKIALLLKYFQQPRGWPPRASSREERLCVVRVCVVHYMGVTDGNGIHIVSFGSLLPCVACSLPLL